MMLSLLRYMRLSFLLQSVLIVTVTFGSFGMSLLRAATAASLKNLTIIEDNVIRAGDLFEGLSRKADTVIGPAPLPGHDMTLNARTLLRIAVALDLPWRPESGAETILIRRAATLIDQNTIEAALQNALHDKGVAGDFKIIFNDALPVFSLPPQEDKTVHVGTFDFDPVHSTFSAELLAPNKDTPLKRHLVQGRIERIVHLPVLSRPLQNGQEITKADLDWIDIPAYKVQPDYLLDADLLVGLTPRRMAMAGEPLRRNDLIEPLLVKRGESVLITYHTGALQLSTEGKALQNGARGEAIRVMNLGSNQTVNALIEGAGQVSVN